MRLTGYQTSQILPAGEFDRERPDPVVKQQGIECLICPRERVGHVEGDKCYHHDDEQ